MSMLFAFLLLSSLPFSLHAEAHMQMSQPYPIRSPLDPDVEANAKDYSYTSPLFTNGTNFPCKGYQKTQPIVSKAVYVAGSQYIMKFAGNATHGGGSCQISLSYDRGQTFQVVKSIIGGCPLQKSYHFKIPAFAPAGHALLAWTWYNHIGDREIYMNCAEIEVEKNHTLKHTSGRFESLPFIWRANLPRLNNCITTEFHDPVFPNPGYEVEYGANMSSNSPITRGKCDSSIPYGSFGQKAPAFQYYNTSSSLPHNPKSTSYFSVPQPTTSPISQNASSTNTRARTSAVKTAKPVTATLSSKGTVSTSGSSRLLAKSTVASLAKSKKITSPTVSSSKTSAAYATSYSSSNSPNASVTTSNSSQASCSQASSFSATLSESGPVSATTVCSCESLETASFSMMTTSLSTGSSLVPTATSDFSSYESSPSETPETCNE